MQDKLYFKSWFFRYWTIKFIIMKKTILIVFIVLNAIVLLGQIWPEGAPPFARIVNIIFLVATLAYFVSILGNKKNN